ncbi:hypothetical protein, partial [Acidovorax sp. 28-64-14]|uniref:hypothetical protein n=1 Tax=Acidovorax sp. 28-64-14 TaxID=1970310 RepID=UPI0025C294B9
NAVCTAFNQRNESHISVFQFFCCSFDFHDLDSTGTLRWFNYKPWRVNIQFVGDLGFAMIAGLSHIIY